MMQVCFLSLTFWMISVSTPLVWLDNHFVFTGILLTPSVYTFNVHLEMEF